MGVAVAVGMRVIVGVGMVVGIGAALGVDVFVGMRVGVAVVARTSGYGGAPTRIPLPRSVFVRMVMGVRVVV